MNGDQWYGIFCLVVGIVFLIIWSVAGIWTLAAIWAACFAVGLNYVVKGSLRRHNKASSSRP